MLAHLFASRWSTIKGEGHVLRGLEEKTVWLGAVGRPEGCATGIGWTTDPDLMD